MLETAGLIIQEDDPNDKRKKLIYPTASFAISKKEKENNSELRGGVNNYDQEKTTTKQKNG